MIGFDSGDGGFMLYDMRKNEAGPVEEFRSQEQTGTARFVASQSVISDVCFSSDHLVATRYDLFDTPTMLVGDPDSPMHWKFHAGKQYIWNGLSRGSFHDNERE